MMPLRLYAAFATLAAPFLRYSLRKRVERGKEWPDRLGERRGLEFTPRPSSRLVWLHAASVGETVSILPVIAALLNADAAVTVLLTTGTVTSAELWARRSVELGAPGRLLHRFVPLDVPLWTHRFVAHWQPDVAGFVESEIWPNLLSACAHAGTKLMLINGRMSPRSHDLWRRVPRTARAVFGGFAKVQAQSAADAARFLALGAPVVTSPGNLKFANAVLPVDAAELLRLQSQLEHRPVWLAASTHPGEERIVMDVHRALVATHPGLLTIIAPRHPARGAEIAALAEELNLTRRSLRQDPPAEGIWLADTLAEMGLLYRLSPIAFVGCSLAVGGGHNPIEPARLGCAVAMGPLTFNCADAVDALRTAGALDVVPDSAGLIAWVGARLDDPARTSAMGRAGIEAAYRSAELPAAVAADLLGLMA